MIVPALTQASDRLESFPFGHQQIAVSCGLIFVCIFTLQAVRLFRNAQAYKAMGHIPGIALGLALFCEAVWPSVKVLLLWLDCLALAAFLCSAVGGVQAKLARRTQLQKEPQ